MAGEITPTSVTQGSTWENNEDCCRAAYAIDKDFSTGSGTGNEDGARWLKLKFDKTYFINKIIIYTRFYSGWYNNEQCVENEIEFKKCVDYDTNVDVSVYQGEVKQNSCGTLQLTYGLERSDQIYTLICDGEGDEIKLSKNTGVIAVHEVVVIETDGNRYSLTIVITVIFFLVCLCTKS